MAKVLVTTEMFPEALSRLREAGHEVQAPAGGRLTRAEILSQIGEADALICLLSDRVDEELLSAAPRLKVVANLGVGVDNVDLAAATQRGVAVTNTLRLLRLRPGQFVGRRQSAVRVINAQLLCQSQDRVRRVTAQNRKMPHATVFQAGQHRLDTRA